jgi:hypothetical protein
VAGGTSLLWLNSLSKQTNRYPRTRYGTILCKFYWHYTIVITRMDMGEVVVEAPHHPSLARRLTPDLGLSLTQRRGVSKSCTGIWNPTTVSNYQLWLEICKLMKTYQCSWTRIMWSSWEISGCPRLWDRLTSQTLTLGYVFSTISLHTCQTTTYRHHTICPRS